MVMTCIYWYIADPNTINLRLDLVLSPFSHTMHLFHQFVLLFIVHIGSSDGCYRTFSYKDAYKSLVTEGSNYQVIVRTGAPTLYGYSKAERDITQVKTQLFNGTDFRLNLFQKLNGTYKIVNESIPLDTKNVQLVYNVSEQAMETFCVKYSLQCSIYRRRLLWDVATNKIKRLVGKDSKNMTIHLELDTQTAASLPKLTDNHYFVLMITNGAGQLRSRLVNSFAIISTSFLGDLSLNIPKAIDVNIIEYCRMF
uniref:Uncharacterized protein n=1 Tax=Tetranychus urticae TaxID=32264 RepID=T1L0M1_TETUR